MSRAPSGSRRGRDSSAPGTTAPGASLRAAVAMAAGAGQATSAARRSPAYRSLSGGLPAPGRPRRGSGGAPRRDLAAASTRVRGATRGKRCPRHTQTGDQRDHAGRPSYLTDHAVSSSSLTGDISLCLRVRLCLRPVWAVSVGCLATHCGDQVGCVRL